MWNETSRFGVLMCNGPDFLTPGRRLFPVPMAQLATQVVFNAQVELRRNQARSI
jgi:hypothetical protein